MTSAVICHSQQTKPVSKSPDCLWRAASGGVSLLGEQDDGQMNGQTYVALEQELTPSDDISMFDGCQQGSTRNMHDMSPTVRQDQAHPQFRASRVGENPSIRSLPED